MATQIVSRLNDCLIVCKTNSSSDFSLQKIFFCWFIVYTLTRISLRLFQNYTVPKIHKGSSIKLLINE